MLPNLELSLYYALTTFEIGISPWMHPSEWLDANTKHIHSIFDGIADSTENADIKTITFPATMIFQVCQLTSGIGSFTHGPSAANSIYFCAHDALLHR
jgi:hypothetical protein